MSQEKTEAVVLRGVDFSETSRIITFLTPQRGRMACLAKGVRRKNSPLGAALDTFNRVELVYYWKDGRQVQTLADAALLDGFAGIKAQLERSAYAGFPLELAYKVAHENEPSEELYAVLTHGLERLAAWPGDARTHVDWQVMRLLQAAGFAPVVDQCVQCGSLLPATPGFSYAGGAVCRACASDRRLSAEEFVALRRMAEAAEGCPCEQAPAGVFHVLRHYAARHLETDFRSVRVLEDMFGRNA